MEALLQEHSLGIRHEFTKFAVSLQFKKQFMSVELKGRLVEKLPPVSGEGRNGRWEKREFIIETEDQYPKKICISVWNDKLSMLEKVADGDLVTVSVNIESREYNSRWYTDIRAWRLERDSDEGSLPPAEDLPPPEDQNEEGDLPF